MPGEKVIIPAEIAASEKKIEVDVISGTAVDRIAKDEAQPSDEADGESEKNYPKGVPFVILTLALMGTVFVAGLDQNILGGFKPHHLEIPKIRLTLSSLLTSNRPPQNHH
jgi:hypothetical protein